jgi:class 3 adenylate cyclase/tetratricopeptide (TPR) repeat protein
MSIVCPSCGQATPAGFPRCANCGAELALEARVEREERKVVTCLFCDLVGFTSQAERMDPEDVRRLLQPYHERVRGELERFGGTVEKFIGDAVMAVFGAPIAHEDDPERAVRAALAIRDWADEEGLELRIGVNTGEALVTVGGEPLAAGDVVNTAARLQAAAPTTGILVGEVTYRATRDAIEYEEHTPVAAKGKAEPVPVWAATQARARVKVEREARAPLVGRRRELSLLRDTLERAHSEREPELITLVGVPGIGKSRLVYELFQTLEARPELVYWRHGRSLPYGDGVTFWALSEIVKTQAGILETDDRDQAEAKLRSAVEAVAGAEDPRWLERNLRPLVGLESEGLAEDRRTEAFAAWRRFLESLAERQPLVLVFEDLHWADDALLDFVDHLIEWARGVPLLVLATARPELLERRPGWGGGKPNAATISLPPLGEDETAELVHALLESPVLSAAVQSELIARAGGNPLYAEEFARLVAEGRAPDELPETIQGLIAARLDALSDDEKSVLQAAAVVGKTFWLGSISTVARTPRWTAEERLHALERKEFVRRERRSSVAGEDEYSFRHLLIRDVSYGQIPRGDRGDKHRLVADWIESLGRAEDHAELLAQHYVAALELASATGRPVTEIAERTREALIGAGDRAALLTSFRSAARFYEHALELLSEEDVGRPELLLRLGGALHYTADERAEQMLEEAARTLQSAGNRERAADAHALLNELWWDRGKRDRSFEHLDVARRLIGAGASDTRAQVLARFARTREIAGEYDEAIPAATEALAIAEQLGLNGVRVHALTTLGVARFELGDPAGVQDLERCIEIAVEAGSSLAANAYNNLGFMYTLAGDTRRDLALRQEAVRIAERFGDERMLRFTSLCLPDLLYYVADWDRSLAEADSAIASFESGSSHYLEANIRWTRAALLHARGQDQAGHADAVRAVEAAREAKDPQMILPALAIRLHIERENEQADAVAEAADELLAYTPRHAARPPAIDLAWAADQLQNSARVRTWTQSIAYRSLWSEAALAILDGELERAADLFSRIGALPDEAYSRLRAAERHAAAGRRAEADEQLHRALVFWRSVGATRYIREGEALLAAAS